MGAALFFLPEIDGKIETLSVLKLRREECLTVIPSILQRSIYANLIIC
jgi:hypothetical protein